MTVMLLPFRRESDQILSTEALKICSDTELSHELDFITDTLNKHGFPLKLTKGQIEKHKRQENHRSFEGNSLNLYAQVTIFPRVPR